MTAIRRISVDRMAFVLLYLPRVRNSVSFRQGSISVIFISNLGGSHQNIMAVILLGRKHSIELCFTFSAG